MSAQPLTIEPGKWYVCRDENRLAYIVFAPFDGRMRGIIAWREDGWPLHSRYDWDEHGVWATRPTTWPEFAALDLIRLATPEEVAKMQRGE